MPKETFSLEEAMGPSMVFADRTSKKRPQPTPRREGVAGRLPSNPEITQLLKNAAEEYGVPVEYAYALAQQESDYNPEAFNASTEATGLMQYIPSTANLLGINPSDPVESARAAMKQFAEQADKHGIEWAIKHHFAGPNTRGHGARTQQYLADVQARAADIRELLGGQFSNVESTASTVQGGPVRFSLEEAMSGDIPTTQAPETQTAGMGDAIAEFGAESLDHLKDAAGRVWDHVKNRFMTDTGQLEMDDPRFRPVRGTADPFEETRFLTKKKELLNAPPEQLLEGFVNNLENPVKLLTQDSLPANFLEFLGDAGQATYGKFRDARKVALQQEIVNNPHKYPAVSVEAAKRAIADREAKQDPSIRAMWNDLQQAATEDPGRFGAQFVNALIADPEMLLAPQGMGLRVLGTSEKAVQGATVAQRAQRIADTMIDAGATGAALNLGIEAAAAGSEGRELTPADIAFAGGIGFAASAALSPIFQRGKIAKDNLKSGNVTEETLKQAMEDAAKVDLASEHIITDPNPISAVVRHRIEEANSIKFESDRDLKEFLKTQRREWRKLFEDRDLHGQFQKALAEERMARREQLAAEAAEREAATAAEDAKWSAVQSRLYETPEARSARFQREYEEAIAARDSQDAADLEAQAIAENRLVEATRKLDEQEIFEAAMNEDIPAVKRAMNSALRRDARLRTPKWHRGAVSEDTLKVLGVSSAAAAAGAAMFPDEPEKGLLAGVIVAGLGLARGSRGKIGAPSRISQEGALKPKGGNWVAGHEDAIDPLRDSMRANPVTTHTAQATKRYLQRYAGTVDDPLKDLVLPGGIRWEDAVDANLYQMRTPNKYGEYEFTFHAGRNVKPLKEKAFRSDREAAWTAIRSYMDHVGDYLRTLPESEILKMDFPRMVKETKRWDEVNARKAEKASVKYFKDATVLKEYPDGFKWIQLDKPGQFANESDLMGHSVRGYEPHKYNPKSPENDTGEFYDLVHTDEARAQAEGVLNPDWTPASKGGHPDYGFGGWQAIKDGRAKVYSLRKPDGKPVATVELAGNPNFGYSVTQVKGPRNNPVKSIYEDKISDFVQTVRQELGGPLYIDDTAMADINAIARKQSGFADTKLLTRLGVGGLFAGAGFALAPQEQKISAAFAAGLAGLMLPGGGSVLRRMAQSGTATVDGDIISLLAKQGKLKVPREASEQMAREADLINRAKGGDQLAFNELFKEHYPRLERYIRKQLGGSGERLGILPEDVAQETFMDVFTKLENFSGDVPFSAYLTRVGKNKTVDVIRKAQSQKRGKDISFKGLQNQLDDSLDDAIVDFDPEVEAATADLDSPENVALRRETEKILVPLIERLPELEQRVFVLHKIEQFTLEDVAAMLGRPLSTVWKAAKDAQDKVLKGVERDFDAIKFQKPKITEAITGEPVEGAPVKRGRGRPKGSKNKWRNQSGEVDPRLLRYGAVASLGAGAGAYLNEQNKLLGAGIGAGLGLALFARGHQGDRVHTQIKNVADYTLGITSTRIMNKSKELWRRAIEHERRVLRDTHAHLQNVDPFLVRMQKLPDETRNILSRAILTGNPEVTNRILQAIGDRQLIQDWKNVRATLDSLGDQLVALRRFQKRELDYFPRVVKDVDGLLKALGKERASIFEEALRNADEKAIRNRGTGLTDLERSLIINKILRSDTYKGQQPGFAKNRGVEEITPELQQFYASPAESLHSYIRGAVEDIERAKFFGRDLEVIKKGNQEYTNVDASIGNLVQHLLKEGKIAGKDVEEVAGLLRSRFINGERAPSSIIRASKNLSYAGLLGNPISATTQLGDTIAQFYVQDMRSTLQAIARNLTGRKFVNMREFGLADHLAEEFVNQSKTSNFLNRVFKYSIFKGVDAFGKDTALNASIIRFSRLAKSEKGIQEITRKYREALTPGEIDQLVKDLRNGEVTDLVRSIAFAELSRSQPITRLELPQAYLDHPDGRLLYQYKTFMLKQIDMARRDGYNEIKKGNFRKGFTNLLELGIVLGIAGTATDKIKDFMLGKDIDLEASDIPMNMLKTFGFSQYVMDNMFGVSSEEAAERREDGDTDARATEAEPIKTVGKMFTPPYQMFEDIITGDPRAVRYIPIIGPFLYEKQKAERLQEQENN